MKGILKKACADLAGNTLQFEILMTHSSDAKLTRKCRTSTKNEFGVIFSTALFLIVIKYEGYEFQ
jgi:hypothetical protein